jgi:hypothetical protein
VRMVLHRVADDIGHLDEPAVVLFMQGPEDAPLHGLQAVGEVRDGAITDDIAGVIEKAAVHARVQAHADFFRIERLVRAGFHHLGDDVLFAVAVSGGFLRGRFFDGRGFSVFDRQFGLARLFLFLGGHG